MAMQGGDLNVSSGNLGLMAGLGGAGGLLSGLMGGGGLLGKGEHVQQFQKYSPQQQMVLNNLLSQGSQNSNWGDIEKNEVNRFNTQTIPGLAERFTSMGDSGQRSSGFQQALGMASSDLGQNLAGMRSQFGMQQLNMGLQPQFENVFRPAQPGGLEQGLGSIMKLLPMLAFL